MFLQASIEVLYFPGDADLAVFVMIYLLRNIVAGRIDIWLCCVGGVCNMALLRVYTLFWRA